MKDNVNLTSTHRQEINLTFKQYIHTLLFNSLHVFLVRRTFFAIFGSYGSVFSHFLGVRGVAHCGSMAQNMPLGPLENGEQKNLLPHNF